MASKIIPLSERLAAKLAPDPASGCINYTGWTDSRGYGQISVPGDRKIYVHRAAYEAAKGPIPNGLVIDHLCRNPRCCNPNHLEAVTQQENTRRGDAGANMAIKTHCPKGHPYDAANTRLNGRGHRLCRECSNAQDRVRPRRRAKSPCAMPPVRTESHNHSGKED